MRRFVRKILSALGIGERPRPQDYWCDGTEARALGVKVGDGTKFLRGALPNFGSEPFLVEIGRDCIFSGRVQFFTHDGAISILRNSTGCEVSKYGRCRIGNHCYIGAYVTFMPGVTVGDGSIIGACSVVTKAVPPGEVWAGHPARFLMTVDEYRKKVLALSQSPEQRELAAFVKSRRGW